MLRFLLLTESAWRAESELAAAAVRRHHPEAAVTWLVCDARPLVSPPAADGDEVRWAADIEVGPVRFADLLLGLGPAGARWAVLPTVLSELLASGADDTVVALPVTSELAAPVDELLTRAAGGTLLLPVGYDAAAGTVTGGWLADVVVAGPRSAPLLGWWQRLAVARARDAEVGRAVTPWADFLDSAPDLHAAGEGRFRVHPASVEGLRLTDGPGGAVLVDGRPLVLEHHPDLDPRRPWRYGDVAVGEVPGLRALCHRRADRLLAAGWAPASAAAEPLPGWVAGEHLRAAYRRELDAALVAGTLPANPYVPGEVATFLAWVHAEPEGSSSGLSLAADDLLDRRSDLLTTFPAVRWRDRRAFQRWMWTSGLDEGDTALALLPPPPEPRPRRPPEHEHLGFGVNLVGYHGSDAGLGVAVRRVALALDAAGIPWTEVRYDRTASRQRGRATRTLGDLPFRFNLILITADQLPLFLADVGTEILDRRYSIGLWYWETDVLTTHQQSSLAHVQELWGATEYLCDVFRAHTDLPVEHLPIPLVFPEAPPRPDARRLLGFDDRFTFLFSFDFLSISRRKNPLGLVEAFRRAFPTGDGVRLVVKSINGDRRRDEKEELLDAVERTPGAELWDRYLEADERLALTAAADCYVSLHRSEGLGLTIAEAMAAGTPVIATRYSGTLDLTTDETALLVDCAEVEIGRGSYYPPHGHWAEPDLDQAAAMMRRIAADPELASRLAAAGRRHVARFDAARTGDAMARRLGALWRG